MLSCREVAQIVPTDDWSFGQRLQLHVHLLYCAKCRALQRQIQVVRAGLKFLVENAPAPDQALAQKIAQDYLKS